MWVIVMFDLPMRSKDEKRRYGQFRKMLLAEGFAKLQFSVYARYCSGAEIAQRHQKNIKKELPPEGQVRVLTFTDVQFGKMEIFEGRFQQPTENAPQQYLLF